MSYCGREVIAHIDRGLVEGEWWLGFADRLTPKERKRIGDGDYAAILRPLEPGWAENEVLTVSPALEIRVGETRLTKRGLFRTVIVKAHDNRGGGRVTQKRIREPLHEVTTICPVKDFGPTYQAEGQRIPNAVVEKLPSTLQAKLRYADLHAKDAERRLRRSLVEDLRRSDFTAAELAVLHAAMDAIREGRELAA